MTGRVSTRSRNERCIGHRAYRCTDQCQNSRRLWPIRGEERTIPVMENLQGMSDMLHNKRRKCKGENYCRFKILTARNDASEDSEFPFSICRFPFVIFHLTSAQMTNDR